MLVFTSIRDLSTSERSGPALTNPSHSEPKNLANKFKHNISANNFRIVSTTSLRPKHPGNNAYTQRKAYFKYPLANNRAVHYYVVKIRSRLSQKPPTRGNTFRQLKDPVLLASQYNSIQSPLRLHG